MNNLKPLVTICVLGVIGYVVYTQLNSKPSTPPPGVAQGWDAAPSVQMPGDGMSASKWNSLSNNPSSNSSGGFLPPPTSISAGTMGGSGAPNGSAPPSNMSTAPSFPGAPSFGGASSAPPANPTGNAVSAPNGSAEAPAAWGTTDPAAAVTANAPTTSDRYAQPAQASYGNALTSPPATADYGGGPAMTAAPEGPGIANPYAEASNADAYQQFQEVWVRGTQLLDEGKMAEGLMLLSQWYDHPKLSATEQGQLTDLLNQAAGTVIYSTQPVTEPLHTLQAGERLEDVAAQYNVPPQLIAKINGVADPATLQPGEQLKVVRGPFNAVISIERRQLTLMLGQMYAGRFSIGVGRDMPPREGSFTVTEKVANPTYHGQNRTIEADDPNNPLGERWISLGNDLGIHGTGPLVDLGSVNQAGSISLGPPDIDDVFDILSVGSKVMIVK